MLTAFQRGARPASRHALTFTGAIPAEPRRCCPPPPRDPSAGTDPGAMPKVGAAGVERFVGAGGAGSSQPKPASQPPGHAPGLRELVLSRLK